MGRFTTDRKDSLYVCFFSHLSQEITGDLLPCASMKRRNEKKGKCFSQMRRYIARHFFGIGTAVVVVVVLCSGLLVYHSVAQANDAPADATLTVGQCIGANATIDPLEKTLIKEGVIEENLLQTKVTNGMCKEMLEPIADSTPTRKLLAAQNYMQQINLIERSMREAAADEAATSGTDAKGPDHHNLAGKPLVLPRWTVLGATEEGSTDGGGIGELNVEPSAYLQDVVHGQYGDGGGGGSTATATANAGGGGGGDNVNGGGGGGGAATGGSDGTGGDEIGGLGPSERQAAAAASAGEDEDASTAERLHKKVAALKKAGASATQAAAGGRCSLEVDVLDEKMDKIKGLYTINPYVPEKMRYGETEDAGLVVEPVTKERFKEITQQQRDIAKASKSLIGCVGLTDQMEATLYPYHLEELGIHPFQTDDIRKLSSSRETRWGWAITTHQTGKLKFYLNLRYAISRKSQEFRLVPHSPVYEKAIKVTPPESNSTHKPWWQRILRRIFEPISRLFGA
jgi:hypothetical protein